MKFLAVFFLVGLALTSAIPVPSSELSLNEVEELDSVLRSFSLKSEDEEESSELGKQLRKRLDELLEKIKDSVEKGKALKEDTLEKLKELREQMKDLKVDLGKKAKELLENLKEKAKDYWNKIWDKFGGNDESKRSVKDNVINRLKEAFEKLLERIRGKLENGDNVSESFLDKLRNIREKLKDQSFDIDKKAREFLERITGSAKEKFQKILEKLGIQERSINFADVKSMKEQKRSIKEIREKIRNCFKELQIELKEKFYRFGEWAIDRFEEGLEKGKDKVENLKKLAREFIFDAKMINRNIAEEAKEFFREYKEDLGSLYEDVRETIREILNRKFKE